uniref:Potassium channel domain-containing protein n=1 Tax=Trichuris muris TaxID=70415 RepID=A0A5S6Q969_TRIMR
MSNFEELTETTSWYSLSVYSLASAFLYAENIRNAMLEHVRKLLPYLRTRLFVLHVTLLLTYLLIASLLTLCEQSLQLDWDARIATEATQRRDELLQRIAELHYQLDEERIPFTSWFNESIGLLVAYESQLEATRVMTPMKRSFRQLLLLLLASITTAGFKAQGPLTPEGRLVLVTLFLPGIYLFLSAARHLGRQLYLAIYKTASVSSKALSVSKKVLLHLLCSLIFTILLSAASVYLIRCVTCNSVFDALEVFIYGSLFIGTGRCVISSTDDLNISLVGIPLYSATLYWFFVCTIRYVRRESLFILKQELPRAIGKSNVTSEIHGSDLEYVDIHSKVMESLRTLPDGAWMLGILDNSRRRSLDRALLRLVTRRDCSTQTDPTVAHVAVQVGKDFG